MTNNPLSGSGLELLRAYLQAIAVSEEMQTRAWETAELTLTQVRALRKVGHQPMPLGELGAALGLTPPSVTRLVDRLERRGLIERTRDGEDRRRVVAQLTEEGRRVNAGVPSYDPGLLAAIEGLAEEDRGRLTEAFRDFVAAVRRQDELPAEVGA